MGVLVCRSLYRLFIKILPALLDSRTQANRQQVVMVGAGVVVVIGPLLSLWLASRLLRSVTAELDVEDAEATEA